MTDYWLTVIALTGLIMLIAYRTEFFTNPSIKFDPDSGLELHADSKAPFPVLA
jgi:hypothetical protein